MVISCHVVARNWTQDLWKSSHLSSPPCVFVFVFVILGIELKVSHILGSALPLSHIPGPLCIPHPHPTGKPWTLWSSYLSTLNSWGNRYGWKLSPKSALPCPHCPMNPQWSTQTYLGHPFFSKPSRWAFTSRINFLQFKIIRIFDSNAII